MPVQATKPPRICYAEHGFFCSVSYCPKLQDGFRTRDLLYQFHKAAYRDSVSGAYIDRVTLSEFMLSFEDTVIGQYYIVNVDEV
eukprot:gene11148-14908_t